MTLYSQECFYCHEMVHELVQGLFCYDCAENIIYSSYDDIGGLYD